jgi:hypothetical protein
VPFSYEIDPDLGVVDVVYAGVFDVAALRESVSALIRVEHEQGHNRFLIDGTGLEIAPSVTMGDIFDIPAEQYVAEGADREGRVAMLPPTTPDSAEAVGFYETAARNRGWRVKVVSDRASALEFLTSD